MRVCTRRRSSLAIRHNFHFNYAPLHIFVPFNCPPTTDIYEFTCFGPVSWRLFFHANATNDALANVVASSAIIYHFGISLRRSVVNRQITCK